MRTLARGSNIASTPSFRPKPEADFLRPTRQQVPTPSSVRAEVHPLSERSASGSEAGKLACERELSPFFSFLFLSSLRDDSFLGDAKQADGSLKICDFGLSRGFAMAGYEGGEMMSECESIRPVEHFFLEQAASHFPSSVFFDGRRCNKMVPSSRDHAFPRELHARWFVLFLAASRRSSFRRVRSFHPADQPHIFLSSFPSSQSTSGP